MTSHGPSYQEPRIPSIPVHSLHVVGRDGEELVHTSVYCLLQERSVPVTECEACERFHALHFDVASRMTSVVCHCEPAVSTLPPEPPRGAPIDPKAPLSDIMVRTVLGVRPDTDLDDVRTLLTRHGISSVPVVDAEGRAVGIVSRDDLLRAEEESKDIGETRPVSARPRALDLGLEPGMHLSEPVPATALDVMSPATLALHERSNIGQAASLMAFEGVHGLPVVADRGEVVGIVSALDILRWFGRRSGYLIPSSRGPL